jgi:hypothetical protein
MAIEKVIDVKIQSEQAEGAVKSLKQQFKEAVLDVQNLSEKFGATSKEVVEASKRAGELKDKIEDANDAIKAFKGEGAFNATAKAVSSVASGFSAVQGAMALMGTESESVEKTLLKVNSAMAIASGLQGLEDAGRSFTQLKAVAINAFNGIKAAIGSTGIGLLVIALGAIYTYWDDIKEAVSGVSEEQKQLNALSQKNLDAEKGKLDAIGSQDNVLKLQGKSEKQILQMKIAQTDQTIKAGEIQIQNQLVTNKLALDAEKRNYKLLRSVLDFLTIPISTIYQMGAKAINGVIELVNKIPGVNIEARVDEKLIEKGKDSLAKLIFDPKETEAEGKKVVAEQKKYLDKLRNDKAGLQLQINGIDKKASDDAKSKQEEKNKKDDEARQKEKDELQKQKDALKSIEEKAAKELEDLKAKTDREKLELQKQRDLEELDNIKLSEEEKAQARADILEKYKIKGEELDAIEAEKKTTTDLEKKQKELEDQTLTFDERRAILAEQNAIITEGDFKTEEERTKAKEANAKARIEIDKLEGKAKIEALDAVASTLSGASELLGKETAAGKAMAVASTTISTISSAQKAYESTIGIPFVGPVLAPINAGLAIAGGIMNVKKILSVQVPGGGGGGASAPSISSSATAGTTSAPQFNVVGNAGTNQLASSLGSAMQQNPVRSFVVASDVTSAQSMNRNIIQNASLG